MSTQNLDVAFITKTDKSIKIYQREKIDFELTIAKVDWTPKQQEVREGIKHQDTKYVMIKGGSGTSKTFLSMAVGLEMLNAGRIKEIVLVRTICESGEISLGSLPGEKDDKIAPFMAPFMDKLQQLLPHKQDIKKLMDDKRIICLPINYLRGREFNACYCIFDEAQNANAAEIQTYLTRFGRFSKFILLGDTEQVDYIKGRRIDSGLQEVYKWYDKEEAVQNHIRCFKFDLCDVMRDDAVKYIIEQYDLMRKARDDYRPSSV